MTHTVPQNCQQVRQVIRNSIFYGCSFFPINISNFSLWLPTLKFSHQEICLASIWLQNFHSSFQDDTTIAAFECMNSVWKILDWLLQPAVALSSVWHKNKRFFYNCTQGISMQAVHCKNTRACIHAAVGRGKKKRQLQDWVLANYDWEMRTATGLASDRVLMMKNFVNLAAVRNAKRRV